jgi:NADH-quinone oxidoreductase subunit N
VNFETIVQSVVVDTLGRSLGAFRPELAICATIIAVLLGRMIFSRWASVAFWLTLIGLGAALGLAIPWNWLCSCEAIPPAMPIFTGTLVSDSFTVVLRGLLLLFAVLFTAFTQISNISNRDDMTEFYVLMLGALLGMCLMISANHILIVLLSVEMASVPCYVLAGMQRNRPKSSEAALKYAVFGAGTAGIMLYGMSLLVGVLGSAHLPTMSTQLAKLMEHGPAADQMMVLSLGGLMLMVGVAFKLSAVPFHFWAPDVFEGTTAEVAAFLSVASKAAALGLLVRLASGFSFDANPDALAALAPVRNFICTLLSVLAAITCTFGNLAAYGQTNMKRLLAYSTIAHAGYMIMPVAAAVALAGVDLEKARWAIASLVVYVSIYLFMNLAAFAIVAFLRNALGSEEIAEYAGLVRRSPGLTVCMTIVMFSLVGLPPLAGFSGKLVIFGSLVQAKLWTLLMIGVLNTVLSLFYYLRVVKVMIFAPEPLHRQAPEIPLRSLVGSYCALLTVPVVVMFFLLDRLLYWANAAASSLFD